MTREEKLEWAKNASNEQLLKQFATTVRRLESSDYETQLQCGENYDIVYAELMKRLG